MDVSDLRKRILRALEDARLDSASKRGERDEAHRAYELFLENVAVPLLRQAQGILRAEQKMFTVHSPAGSAKLVSDTSAQTFLEFLLDNTGDQGGVLGRISHPRGRRQVVVDERPIAPGKSVAELTDEDVAAFLLAELPKLVGR